MSLKKQLTQNPFRISLILIKFLLDRLLMILDPFKNSNLIFHSDDL